jgi:hypothetical protein
MALVSLLQSASLREAPLVSSTNAIEARWTSIFRSDGVDGLDAILGTCESQCCP